jgi:transposase, IS5 family
MAMIGKQPCQIELDLFEPVLRQVLMPDHPLRVMADSFPWKDIEIDYSKLYSPKGAPAKPVRLMAGLLILKHIFNGTDEGVANEWARDRYFQYFCGRNTGISNVLPCDPSDLAHFRKRIGPERLARLLNLSAEYQQRTEINKLIIIKGTRPGQQNFAYSASSGVYQSLIRKISGLAGKCGEIFSRAN